MKRLLIGLGVSCVMLMTVARAQNGINSPFSQFGVGLEDAPYTSPFAIGMGAILASGSNNQINMWNPASYAKVESRSFVFDIGLGVRMSRLSDNNSSQFDADGYLSHLAVAFPFCKWWKTSFSVQPYTDVDYSLTIASEDTATYGKMNTIYSGSGGVNRFTWGHAFNIGERVAIGFNLHLLYGRMQRYITYDFLANDTTYYIDCQRQKNTRVLNFSTDIGVRYERPISEKYKMAIGLTMRPGLPQKIKESVYKYTYLGSVTREVIYPTGSESSEYKSILEESWSAGLGVNFERNDKWQIAVDYVWAQWNGMKYEDGLNYRVFSQNMSDYKSYQRIAVGFAWLGDAQSSFYRQRVGYSVGLHYELNKLVTTTAICNEIGVGVGVRLPIRKGRSVINLAAGYSHFGEESMLVRDCYTIGVSLGSCESWFVKRKYN